METYIPPRRRPAPVAARGARDLLQLLANPTNRTILGVLSVEPQYPRRLAELVGITEDEASKRLRLFEEAGLAEGSWANVGKNVRLYRLSTTKFTVSVDAGGLSVAGLPGAKSVQVSTVMETAPSLERFVGREAELRAVEDQLAARRAVCVLGIGGAGKTALAAAYAQRSGRPTLWHTLAPGESGPLLLTRLASAQRPLDPGERSQRLLSLRDADEESLLVPALLESLNARGTLLVLDRLEGAGEGAVDLVATLARGLADARLLVTGRSYPQRLPRDLVASYRLPGLGVADSERLLSSLGARLGTEAVQEVFDRTHGHPLSLVLVAQVAQGRQGASVEGLMQESGIRDFLVDDVLPQLSDAERDLLYALSVFRHPFLVEEAEAVADARHAQHALVKLEGRGLVGRAGDLYFLHDLVRGIVADVAPQKKILHGRAAKALKASGVAGKVLEAAQHYLEAGASGEAAAIVREEATRRLYRFSDEGLAAGYREVLTRLANDAATDALGRATAELELGTLDTFSGNGAEARQHLAAAEPGVQRERSLKVPFLIARGRLHRLDADMDAACSDFDAAQRAAEVAADPARRVEALLDWGFMEEERDDPKAFRLYRLAIDVAQKTSDLRGLSVAYAGAARIGMRQGDTKYLGWAQEALRLARLTGYLRGEVQVYMTLTTHAMMVGQTETGLEFSERYLRVANQLGDAWLKACAINDQALLLVASKRYGDALGLSSEAIDLSRMIKSTFFEFGAHLVRAEALLGLGRAKEALGPLREAMRLKGNAWPMFTSRAWRTTAAAHRALGQKAEARHAEAEAASWARRPSVPRGGTDFLRVPVPSTPAPAPTAARNGPERSKRERNLTVRTRGRRR